MVTGFVEEALDTGIRVSLDRAHVGGQNRETVPPEEAS